MTPKEEIKTNLIGGWHLGLLQELVELELVLGLLEFVLGLQELVELELVESFELEPLQLQPLQLVSLVFDSLQSSFKVVKLLMASIHASTPR